MNIFQKTAEFVGRFGLAAIFLISGFGKIAQYAGTQAYMAAAGVPGSVLPLVIAVEVLGGAAIVVGLYTRVSAVLLAGFSLVTALLFHAQLSDPIQQIMFLKNIAMAGGFLILAAQGAGAWSLDARIERRS
jgi:putative oxidoreductase